MGAGEAGVGGGTSGCQVSGVVLCLMRPLAAWLMNHFVCLALESRRKQYHAQLDAIRAYLAGAAEHMAAMRARQQARRGKLEAQVTALRAALKEAEKRRRAAEASAKQGAGAGDAEVRA